MTLTAMTMAPGATGGALRSPAGPTRSGASSSVTVSARIIRASAAIGHGRAPPHPRMKPRRTTVSAADGRAIPALVYDFE